MASKEDRNLELENSILGCLYGNCIGDAIGLLTEFMTKGEAQQRYGKEKNLMLEYKDKVSDKHRDCWVNGDWTDDSDQMILIMDSIIDCQQETQAKTVNVKDFAERLRVWSYHGFPELGDTGGFGLGNTTHMVLNHKRYATNPHQAAKDAWERTGRFVAPNGAVMRTSVLGIYNYRDLKSVQENCKAIAKVTHADPRCLASCVAVCSAIVFMLQRNARHLTSEGFLDVTKITKDSYHEAVKVFTEDKERNSEELWQHMTVDHLSSLQLDEPGKIGYTYKSLGAGFWALRHKDFRSALTSITMEAGDADTNGAVAGALLGCKMGFQYLPDTWVDGLVNKQWLDNKIYRFMKATMPEMNMKLIHFAENFEAKVFMTPRQIRRQQRSAEKAEEEKRCEDQEKVGNDTPDAKEAVNGNFHKEDRNGKGMNRNFQEEDEKHSGGNAPSSNSQQLDEKAEIQKGTSGNSEEHKKGVNESVHQTDEKGMSDRRGESSHKVSQNEGGKSDTRKDNRKHDQQKKRNE